ncbi:hypothetical protein GWK47_040173 [Chionoecetes opilio]|uniref:Uncharacterized protein n=1 Tax=Chionoecetes opilio TaxID=41210 RepID=A0A8J4YAY4_CHIOP|nr:hypothetical protein GWK47_040173 [Chionoecetes opilio]
MQDILTLLVLHTVEKDEGEGLLMILWEMEEWQSILHLFYIFLAYGALGGLYSAHQSSAGLEPVRLVVYLTMCQLLPMFPSSSFTAYTKRHLTTRIAEHRGLSHRTGKPVSKPPFSAIRDHSEASGHPITNQDFNILHTSSHDSTRWICESLLTHHHKPSLCAQGTSTPLLCF